MFHDAEFKVFRWKGKWRISEKSEFEWEHGFVDVQACKNLKDGMGYIIKYIGKAHNLGKKGSSSLTLALTWFYRKRSWSMSKGFNDLIKQLHKSKNIASDMWDSPDQRRVEWHLLGFWGGYPLQLILDDAVLGFTREITVHQFRAIYGSPGWGDFNVRMVKRVGVHDYEGTYYLKREMVSRVIKIEG
ncbi:hypothetical protein ES703_90451 [subsurface metagenome]